MDTNIRSASELLVSIVSEHSISSPSSKDLSLTGNERSDSGYECHNPDDSKINFHDLSFIPELENTVNDTSIISNLLDRVAALEYSHGAHDNMSQQVSSLTSRVAFLENKVCQFMDNLTLIVLKSKESQDTITQVSNQLISLQSTLRIDLASLKKDLNDIAQQSSFNHDLSLAIVSSPGVPTPVCLESPIIAGSTLLTVPTDAGVSPNCCVFQNGTINKSKVHPDNTKIIPVDSDKDYIYPVHCDSMINDHAYSGIISSPVETRRSMVSQAVQTFKPQVFQPSGYFQTILTNPPQDQFSQLNVSADNALPHTEMHQSMTSHLHDQVQSQVDDFASNASSSSTRDETSLSSLSIQGKLLKSQMIGLKTLLSPNPSKDLSKSTLLDLHKNRVMAVEDQTQYLQSALCEYVRIEGHCLQLCEQVLDGIDSCISWSSKIRELYQSTGAYKRSQGSKLFDTLSKFSPSSELDIYTFLERFESLTEEFDFPEEKAQFLYNRFLSSSVQEETVKYKNCYDLMKRFLIHRYGDPRVLISQMIECFHKDFIPDNMSDSQMCLSYYRRLHSTLEKINLYLDPSTGYQDDFESYVFSQEFLNQLLVIIPLDSKLEFFKLMKQHNEDTLRIKGKTAFKLLLNTVNERYEIHDRVSFYQPTSVSKKGKGSRLSCNDQIQIDSNSGKGSPVLSSQRESVNNISTELNSRHVASDHKYPCILPGHDHSIVKCKEFFSKESAERVNARKISGIKHCAVCLQSSNSCKGGKCSNISSVPDILICRDCKQINMIDRKRPCYSVLFCLSPTHRKPTDLDVMTALESYIPGFHT